ncbi:MAG: YigZ family protein [Pseudoclavibacter sp.]|nr:YigZ family protein [Pseudoclavibacter sp.]
MDTAGPEEYTVLRSPGPVEAEIEVRRSVFRCVLQRTADEEAARETLARVRAEHRQARHHCSAFLLGPGRAVQRTNDDGEPSGTAGAPMLEALCSREGPRGRRDLSDLVAIVVRWFGGVLLGTGGLTRAYGDAVGAALDRAELGTRARLRELALTAPHDRAGRWEHELRARGLAPLPAEYRPDGVRLRIAVPDRPAELRAAVQALEAVSSGAAVDRLGTAWRDVPS